MSTDPAVGEPAESAPTEAVFRRSRRSIEISISGRSIWHVIGAVVATLALLWAVREASTLVSLVAISFFFSLALDPIVRRLVDRFEWRRGSATGLIYVVGILLMFFLIGVLIPAVVQLANTISEHGTEWIAEANSWANDTFGIEITSGQDASDFVESLGGSVKEWAGGAVGRVVDVATTGLALVFNLATIALFTFYFTAKAPQVQAAVLKLFTPVMQERIGWTWDQAIVQTGGYFYSRIILMAINGLGFFFTMLAVGVPTFVSASLALFGSFVSVFIPAIGTYIGGAIPILVTLALQGLTPAIIVLAYVLVYQQVENYWLSPHISANTMSLNGGVAFGAALAGAALGGPMGAFVALPVAALIASFVSNYVASHEVVYKSQHAQDDEWPEDGDEEATSEDDAD